jgi:hypothetical protein
VCQLGRLFSIPLRVRCLECRKEEAIAALQIRAHTGHALMDLYMIGQVLGKRGYPPAWMSGQECFDLRFVFFPPEATGGIHQQSAHAGQGGAFIQELALHGAQGGQVEGSLFQFRVTPEGARTGAGCVDQNPIERPAAGERRVCARGDRLAFDIAQASALTAFGQPLQPFGCDVAGQYITAVAHFGSQPQCLAAGTGA